MDRQWKCYAIFISSTFLDMDAERDAIKFEVVNRLNQHYKTSFTEFCAIDLRSGINTASLPEQEREDRVLDICFSSIDASRPFFIGLLGGRYGWIPSEERSNHIRSRLPLDKQSLLSLTSGLSVTEMEILYGAIGDDGKYLDHSLFFCRRNDSYKDVPPEKLPFFLDDFNSGLSEKEKEDNREKRKNLREKIDRVIENSDCDAKITEYSLEYDKDNEKFTNLAPFAELVFEQLCSVIDKELAISGKESFLWHIQETRFSNLLQSRTIIDTIDITGAFRHEGHNVFITGDAGIGKTVLLSQLYKKDSRDDRHKHIAFVGITPFAHRIRTILIRWLIEMGKWEPGNDVPDANDLPDADLFRDFQGAATDEESFYLDGLEGLPYEEQSLGWISESMNIVVSGDEQAWEKASIINHGFYKHRVCGLKSDEVNKLIDYFSTKSFFDIPGNILADLFKKDYSPEQLALILKMLSSLSSADYQQIRRNGGQITEINDYLENLYNNITSQRDTLYLKSVERFASTLWKLEGGVKTFEYLALSPLGLRESDISALIGPDWDITVFLRIVYYFESLFTQNPNTLCWQIKSSSLKKELLKNCDKAQLYSDLSKHIFSLDDADYLKRSLGIYFGIKAHSPSEAIPYLGSREHFSGYDDVSVWYFYAGNLLQSDSGCRYDLEQCCQNMTDGQKSIFLRHYFGYGCGFCLQIDDHLALTRSQLIDADVSMMDKISAYDLGWLLADADLYLKYKNEPDSQIREKILNLAVAAFRHCLSLDPSYAPAKNMLTATSTALMNLYIKEHRFDEFKTLYNSLKL